MKKTYGPWGDMSEEEMQDHHRDHHGGFEPRFEFSHDDDHVSRPELDHIHAERVVPTVEIIQEKINWRPTELLPANWMYIPDYLKHVRDRHPREYSSIAEHDQHHQAEPDIFDHTHKTDMPRGTRPRTTEPTAKLTGAIVLDCRRRHAAGQSIFSLAREYGVASSTMYAAIMGQTWRHVKEESGGDCS